jgi:transketolase
MMVPRAIDAGERLAAEGVSAEVINMHTIKPLDEELVVASAKKTGKVITIEEASYVGGLGTAVCEVLSEKCPTKVTRIGLPDIFGMSGAGGELLDIYGLTADHIIEAYHEM